MRIPNAQKNVLILKVCLQKVKLELFVNSDILVSEMAKEMSPEASPVKVKCSANYCIHNENSECIAKEITVGNENANYRSETECDSFKAR